MSTPDRCLAQAQEAERLAETVSYGRDREQLMQQAAEWRRRAAELEAKQADVPQEAPSWLDRCAGALFGPRRGRDD